jgi:UDP-N-acetylglucosamine:LPS N-acetylglucosamine transferase
VPTQLAGEALLRRGVAPGRVLHTGMPLRRAFWPGSIQQGLADDAQHDTIRVLVMDGGAPGPALGRAARALLAAGLPLSLSLAWGRSTPARLAVPDGPCTVRHLTWDASIAAEMSIADLVVTKAGSVSIAEALALGRPIVIHRVVPGQESSNPGYLQASGAGCAALSPAELVRWVRHLAAEPYRRAMATSARELGRPSAALKVAMHVLTALGERAVSEAAG